MHSSRLSNDGTRRDRSGLSNIYEKTSQEMQDAGLQTPGPGAGSPFITPAEHRGAVGSLSVEGENGPGLNRQRSGQNSPKKRRLKKRHVSARPKRDRLASKLQNADMPEADESALEARRNEQDASKQNPLTAEDAEPRGAPARIEASS